MSLPLGESYGGSFLLSRFQILLQTVISDNTRKRDFSNMWKTVGGVRDAKNDFSTIKRIPKRKPCSSLPALLSFRIDIMKPYFTNIRRVGIK